MRSDHKRLRFSWNEVSRHAAFPQIPDVELLRPFPIAVGEKMRKLTQSESSVVRTLGSFIADDRLRSQFLIDINEVEVTEEASDGSRLRFHLPPSKFSFIEAKTAFAAVTDFQSREKCWTLAVRLSKCISSRRTGGCWSLSFSAQMGNPF